MQTVTERLSCRICQGTEFESILDIGAQQLGSHFTTAADPEIFRAAYPLHLVRCSAPHGCGLVQLKHTVDPSVLYYDYGYLSGLNEMMRQNLRTLAGGAEELVRLDTGDVVLDIGCNDGTLLLSYQTRGIDRLGIDPSTNVTAKARQAGLDVVNDYFSFDVFAAARPGRRAKIITSIAMFYDLEDPSQFVRDVSQCLADDGVWVIELSYLPSMLETNSFDTICHEHLEYYSIRQIEWMVSREGMAIHRVEFNDVNGGSFRLYIRKQAMSSDDPDDAKALLSARAREDALELDKAAPYVAFRERSLSIRDQIRRMLISSQEAGKRTYVYGASTKGNTLLQFCGIDEHIIPKAADRNPAKWGRRTPGSNIPIVSEEEARADAPDCFLVLPWHFLPAFKEREADFLNRGGRFLVPLPEPRFVGADQFA